jgi:hypothetical protein
MTKALTPIAEQEITQYDPADFADMEWESDGTEDIRVAWPVLKIVQPTSGMADAGQHGGHFYHSGDETYYSSISGTMLMIRKTRAAFEEGNAAPVCMSADGIEPLPSQPLWDGWHETLNQGARGTHPVPKVAPASCAECPFSQWDNDNDKPPACGASDVILIDMGPDPEHADLAQLRVSGKSLGVVKAYVARKLKPKMIPLLAHRVQLTAVPKKEGTSKRWNELVITQERVNPKATIMQYNQLIREYRQSWEREVTGAPAEAKDEWDVD